MVHKLGDVPASGGPRADFPFGPEEAGAEKASFAYLPALDGLRAVSISLVVVSHAGLHRIVPGGLGVIIFFVISGFLLTRQMIAEIERSGTLRIGNFYARRAFRLVPTLLVYVLVFNVLLTSLGADISAASVLSGIFYFANYYFSFFDTTSKWNPNAILWSLSVEEHFYIAFPALMFAYRRRLNKMVPVLCLFVLCVLVWRFYLYSVCHVSPERMICGIPNTDRVFHATDSVIDCIAYGALAALILHYRTDDVRRMVFNRSALIAASICLLATLLIRNPMFRDTVRFSLQSLSIAVIMLNVLFSDSCSRVRSLLASGPAVLLGRMSYSLYLFHFGILMLVLALFRETEFQFRVDLIFFYIVGSFACAAASYRFIEKPMARVRRRLRAEVAGTSRANGAPAGDAARGQGSIGVGTR